MRRGTEVREDDQDLFLTGRRRHTRFALVSWGSEMFIRDRLCIPPSRSLSYMGVCVCVFLFSSSSFLHDCTFFQQIICAWLDVKEKLLFLIARWFLLIQNCKYRLAIREKIHVPAQKTEQIRVGKCIRCGIGDLRWGIAGDTWKHVRILRHARANN